MFFLLTNYFLTLTNLQLVFNLSPSFIKVTKKLPQNLYWVPLTQLHFSFCLLVALSPRSTHSIAAILHCVTRYGGESQPQPHATIYCSFIKCDIGSSNSLGHFTPNWTQTTPNQSGSEPSRERSTRRKVQQNSCPKIKKEKRSKAKWSAEAARERGSGMKRELDWSLGLFFNLLTFINFRLATWNLCATVKIFGIWRRHRVTPKDQREDWKLKEKFF